MESTRITEAYLRGRGILKETHCVLTSGRHSNAYLDTDMALSEFDIRSAVCAELAGLIHNTLRDGFTLTFDVFIGVATGGNILATSVSDHLGHYGHGPKLAFAEKLRVTKSQGIRDGSQKHLRGKRVLIIEDVVTTGSSVGSLFESIRRCGGEVVAVAAICNRNRIEVTGATFGENVKFLPLVNLELPSWTPEECPLCAQSVPVDTTFGHG